MKGEPIVAGTRITVRSILERQAAGESDAQIIEVYPILVPDDLRAAQRFAAEMLGAGPVRRVETPPPPVAPELPDIHGWPAAKVQELQRSVAQALGRPVVFRDPLNSPVKLPRSFFAGVLGKAAMVIDQGPEMVIIPAGRFLMGSPAGEAQRFDFEGPQHPVTISRPFAIGRYAVTFDDYDAFCAATGRDKGDEGWGRGRRPVVDVTWDDALAYCQWLFAQTGRPYRLPTEAEWEYACRAGTASPFHFGETLSTGQANYVDKTVPVGSLPPNPWGLCEMHGNVCEWCQDWWFGHYEAGPIADPGGPASGGCRVLRGGSWFYGARDLRSAYRSHFAPGLRHLFDGFRLALGPELRQARPAG
jgi:formylglycine-generating enzyme required for sulfatase activity/uncharacterized protein (DUF433 family)